MKYVGRITPHLLLAFLVGVALASFFHGAGGLLVFFLLLAFALACIAAITPKRKHISLLILVLALASLGMTRFAFWSEAPRDPLLESQVGQTITFTGIVVDEPDVREMNTRLTVQMQTLSDSDTLSPVSDRALLTVSRYPEYHYGDVLSVKGKLLLPKKFTEDDGRVFDYPMYLASKGIHYQVFLPDVTFERSGEGNVVMANLYAFKHYFLEKLAGLFPEPHNALLAGLLLGGKQSLGTAWLDIFRTAGIVHIIVLSGYNMTIVAEWLVIGFRFLGFYGSLSMGGIGIVLFTLMTGAGATVVRAAIMALIALLARATGRTSAMSRALLLAATLMVLQNPSILAYDPSFQLSFLASLGLILVAPVIERRTILFSRSRMLREVFVATLATQLMVLPLLLYQTGQLSLVALPANMLVLPVIPLTMLTGFCAGVAAVASPTLAWLFVIPTHFLLSWILFIAERLSSIPYAAVAFPIAGWTVAVLYVLLGIFLWREQITALQAVPSRVPPLPLLNSRGDKKDTLPEAPRS